MSQKPRFFLEVKKNSKNCGVKDVSRTTIFGGVNFGGYNLRDVKI